MYLRALQNSLKWTALSKIGQMRLMKLTALVPIIGYILVFNEPVTLWLSEILSSKYFIPGNSLANVNDLSGQYAMESQAELEHLPPSLTIIYIGGFLLGLGSILFIIFCPPVFSDFPSSPQHIEAEISCASQSRFRNLVEENEQIVSKFSSDKDRNVFEEIKGVAENVRPATEYSDNLAEVTDIIRRSTNQSRPVARYLIAILYVFGFGLVLTPSAWNFYLIIIDFFSSAL